MSINASSKSYQPDDIVKSCRKLEAGLRFGQEGVSACALGPFQSPIYWGPKEAAELEPTKEMIAEKRKWIFDLLNDDHSETPCKGCQMVHEKPYKEVSFDRLGHIDFSETSLCNIRCNYCYYTKADAFNKSNFDSLGILKQFGVDDVEWDAAVDFGGGEPTILPNFAECIDYFHSRKIRVFLYTNGAKYSQAAYDGIINGTISWLCVSLDCGTPSTYIKTKERKYFPKVMENLFKYVEAAKRGIGHVSVKYIFTEDNCGDDDIYGFTYAMLALQPDKVWLTFDFEPLKGLPGDSDDFGDFDYQKLVDAYVKMYLLMKGHGLIAGHFAENHLSQVSRHGQILLESVTDKIKQDESKREAEIELPELLHELSCLKLEPTQIKYPKQIFQEFSLKNKRILMIPASNMAVSLSKHEEILDGEVVGFIDRDPMIQGKIINDIRVYGYEDIELLKPDVIIIAAHEQHQADISHAIDRYSRHQAEKLVYQIR